MFAKNNLVDRQIHPVLVVDVFVGHRCGINWAMITTNSKHQRSLEGYRWFPLYYRPALPRCCFPNLRRSLHLFCCPFKILHDGTFGQPIIIYWVMIIVSWASLSWRQSLFSMFQHFWFFLTAALCLFVSVLLACILLLEWTLVFTLAVVNADKQSVNTRVGAWRTGSVFLSIIGLLLLCLGTLGSVLVPVKVSFWLLRLLCVGTMAAILWYYIITIPDVR